jgi:carotenoid 1,2-hydratase
MEYRHPVPASQTSAVAPPVDADGPRFSVPVADRGYAWWYVDAWSDCGRHGLTLIAMLGCVFSPWYARARRRADRSGAARPPAVDPLDHSGLNVALYGAAGHRWALTERGVGDVERTATRLAIGPSALSWDGEELRVSIDERTAPWPRALRGTVRVRPGARLHQGYALDAATDGAARHLWWPIAPRSRVSVEFAQPSLAWHGDGYLDANAGRAPLEDDFDSWNWSRAHRGEETRVFYDTVWRDAPPGRTAPRGRSLALAFDAQGVRDIAAPPVQRLPTTPWGIRRETRSDHGRGARVLATLEDGPFYARSRIGSQLDGALATGFHESVSLRRFAAPWVQVLLPVRLPRRPLAR